MRHLRRGYLHSIGRRGGLRLDRRRLRRRPSDFTYARSLSRSSSFTCPWNVGMIGWKPFTDLRLRVEDRFADVVVVRLDDRVVAQRDVGAVQSREHRAAAGGVVRVAGVARVLLEELLALRRQRSFAAAGEPASDTSLGSITSTHPIIPECSVPQYSAQKMW